MELEPKILNLIFPLPETCPTIYRGCQHVFSQFPVSFFFFFLSVVKPSWPFFHWAHYYLKCNWLCDQKVKYLDLGILLEWFKLFHWFIFIQTHCLFKKPGVAFCLASTSREVSHSPMNLIPFIVDSHHQKFVIIICLFSFLFNFGKFLH